MPHPPLQPGYHDAAAEGMNEKAVPDALRQGVRPARDPGLCDHPACVVVHRHFAETPQPLIGVETGPGAADAMHLFEQFDEGVRDRNGPRDLGVVRVGKSNRSSGKVNLMRHEIERFGEIAAGVMQQAAKGLDVIPRAARCLDKGLALLLIEKEAFSLIVEKMCSWHVIVLVEEIRIEKAPFLGAFSLAKIKLLNMDVKAARRLAGTGCISACYTSSRGLAAVGHACACRAECENLTCIRNSIIKLGVDPQGLIGR